MISGIPRRRREGSIQFRSYVPNLPDCVAAANTHRDVRKLIRDGIEPYVRALREAGKPVPAPMARTKKVKIRAA